MTELQLRPSQQPCVFLFGCDRSGTTLFRSILNSHPDLMITYEAPASITLRETFQDHGLRPTIDALRTFPQFDQVDWLPVIDQIEDLGNPTLADVVAATNQNLLLQNSKSMWGDKTPAYTRFIPQLEQMYPNAKFVHIVRDPRAVATSWIETDWGPNTPFHAAREWVTRVREASDALHRISQSRWTTVRFEDLLSDPEKSIQRICDFIGISFDAGLFQNRSKSDDGLPTDYFQKLHARSQKELDSTRVHRWQALAPKFISQIESQAWQTMSDFGYEPVSEDAPQLSRWRILQCKLQNRLRRINNEFRRQQSPPLYPLPS